MYARHRLDLELADLALAAQLCVGRRVAAPDAPGALTTLSVRSGFHLLLQALALPVASEVIFSALTHPDLPRLVAHHGLVPVPVDLEAGTLAPSLAQLEARVNERTRVIVVAHLFGGRVDLGGVASVARRHGLLLVEDCAQALSARHDSGDARADVSMFSFGLLKTATAAGGGVLHIRNPELLREMRLRHDRWPEQGNRAYAGRLVRAAALVELSRPRPYAVLAAGCRAAGRDLDALVHSRTRSFRSATTADLARQLEWRPARALAAMVAHRQATIDEDRIERRRLAGEEALGRLPAGVVQPGWAMPEHTHWLFPVVAPDPDALVARARAAGFDAARAASNLVAVAAPAGCDELEPVRARAIVSSLVYLPMYPEIPARDRARLLEALELGAARANAA